MSTAGVSNAAETSFSQRLKAEEQTATGVAKLSDTQRSVLDNLVERELRLAREGNVNGFAGEFTTRRSPPELAKAGVDKLTEAERAQLNAKVAEVLASRPVEPTGLAPVPRAVAARGVAPKPIVHGEISFTYGMASGGRDFYGTSFYVEQTDPVKGYTIGIGVSQFRGDGVFFYDPYDAYCRWGRGPYGWYGRRY